MNKIKRSLIGTSDFRTIYFKNQTQKLPQSER